MPSKRHIARDISYSHSAQTRSGRAVIRTVENMTGRLRMIKRASGYDQDVARGADFWQVMVERYGLSLDVVGGSLDNVPQTGPLILIANHPYGILDGLMMGHILSQRRAGDFRILAHRVFRKSEDLNKVILPISFDETREAVKQNLDTRKEAELYLKQGGAIGIFPGGTVSTSATPFSKPMDPSWRNFTARLVAKSGATVVPVFFAGHTSRLFQIASHMHTTLRMSLLIKEFAKRVDTPVQAVIGQPIVADRIADYAGDSNALMEFLRKSTYDLSPAPLNSTALGFEFEDKHRPLAERRS